MASIDIMPRAELLDPQGKTVAKNLKNIEIEGVEDVRIGKHILIKLNAENMEDARMKVETSCKDLLANIIMETYSFKLEAL